MATNGTQSNMIVCGSVRGLVTFYSESTFEALRVFDLSAFGSITSLSFSEGEH